MTFAGMFFGALFYFSTEWLKRSSDVQKGFIFLALLSPSLISALLDLPRPVKHVSRFLLGLLLTSAAILLFVTDSWAVRLAVIGVFLAVRIPLERKRRRDNEALQRAYNEKASGKKKKKG